MVLEEYVADVRLCVLLKSIAENIAVKKLRQLLIFLCFSAILKVCEVVYVGEICSQELQGI